MAATSKNRAEENASARVQAWRAHRDELGLAPWDLAVLISTVALAVLIPVEAVFPDLDAPWLMAVSIAISIVLGIDIRRRLRSSDSTYLTRWLVIDVLAAVPFDVVAEAPGIADSDVAVVLRGLALLRVLRMVRFIPLQRSWRLHTSLNPALLRLGFFAMWVALVAHLIACGWIALDGPASGPPDLAPYQSALYWSITTLTTVGYGDIVPIGSSQTYFTMLVMALGVAMYGYIIGNVASLVANVDVVRSEHLARVESINHFMRDRRIPPALQTRVRDYYDYLWRTRSFSEVEVLEDLPSSLQVDIRLHLNRHMLSKVLSFRGADDEFFRELVARLEPVVFVPGEALMRRGEIGQRLYFINRGSVEVLSPDEEATVAVLGAGDFVGEMALLSDQPRANTVTAVDYCNAYALDRDGLHRVLDRFPHVAAEVRRIARERRAEAAADT